MSHLCLLGVATLTLTSAGFAGSDTNADLQARLEAAETRISELSAATNNNWLNDARSDEIRSLVHDVLADADTRASLQGSGATAGYNGGFTIGSADGNWSMTINGLLQTRWVTVDNEAVVAPAINTGNQWGFDNHRSWLNYSGTIAGDYSYDVRHGWGPVNSQGDATWANGSFNVGDGWNLTAGTMKRAVSREQLIDDQNQLALDRDNVYTVGQGFMLDYAGDDMSFAIQMFNAQGGAVAAANNSAYTWLARVEYLAEGSWGQFDQFTSADGGEAGTLIGFSYMNNDDGDSGTATEDQVTWNLDVQMQYGGSSLYVSYQDFSDDLTTGAGNTDFDELQVMFGYYLDSDWELYVRYVDNDGTTAPAAPGVAGPMDGEILSIGLNNYWAGQNAKWTTEVIFDDTAVGNNTDVTTIATQLQFYF
jgi:hypothetical protein